MSQVNYLIKLPGGPEKPKLWVAMVLYLNKYQKTLFLSWSLNHIFSKIFYFNHMNYLEMSSTIQIYPHNSFRTNNENIKYSVDKKLF